MRRRGVVPAVLALLLLLPGRSALAEGFFSAGGGDEIRGADYRIEEGILDFTSRETLASAQFQLEGQIGSIVPAPPRIESVEPGPKSSFFEDESPAYAITAVNPGSGSLEYQVRSDGAVKVGWQASPATSYPVSGADIGRHELEFLAKNPGGSALLPADQFIFRRPRK